MQTERLLLRAFRLDDAPVLAAYRSDPQVARYQSWDAPFPLRDAVAFIAGLDGRDPRAEGWFQYAIERTQDGLLIGDVGVNRHDLGRQAEIGFTLEPRAQGHGYAAEAVRRVVDHLLVGEGLHRVHASVDGRNARSARLLSRLGFRREGLELQSGLGEGGRQGRGKRPDDARYAVLASEWSRSPSAESAPD
ncbi:GNAT family N-acetyltransferase [Dactylosporangium sp. CA-233914]|uniref:GNAT family N-acetyltransferase n=1 Tax=Dactylosporangium sp. CA-233914 TaxID=3239934 RepID=UPI003D8B64EA